MDLRGLSDRDVIGRFFERLEMAAASSWISKISMHFPSNQEVETYKWLGMAPALSAWVGRRRPTSVREEGVTITNKLFDATMEIDSDDFRRDKTGQINVRVGELATRAVNHWASLLTTQIENGETTTCYDGQFFFDTDHPIGDTGSTQSNDLSGGIFNVASATAPTSAEMVDVILAMIQHLFTLKDDQNEPINELANSFLVMVPVPFMGAAVKAIKSDRIDTGSGTMDNPLKDTGFQLELAVNPRLTWTTQLAVFRTDGDAKPLIRQSEDLNKEMDTSRNEPAGQTSFDETFGIKLEVLGEGSEHAKKNRSHLYIAEASRNTGYGYYEQAVLATLS